MRNGPNPTNGGYPGTSPGASFFSAYRMWDQDPLPFEGKMELWWRNGGPKCMLPQPDEAREQGAAPILPGPNKVHSMVWYYTWDSV